MKPWLLIACFVAMPLCAQTSSREKLHATFDREIQREKMGDCKGSQTTVEVNRCLDKEIDTTEANYKAFTAVLRTSLARDEVKDFDQQEATWSAYRKQICTAAFRQYEGGTHAPAAEGECRLMLVRSHMRELRSVYDALWR